MTDPKKRRRRRPISQTNVRDLVVAVTHLVEQLRLLTAVLDLAVREQSRGRARPRTTQGDDAGKKQAKLWEGNEPTAIDVIPLPTPAGGIT